LQTIKENNVKQNKNKKFTGPLERKHGEIIDKAMKEQEKHKEIEKENSDGEKQKENNEGSRIELTEA
jgi:hypothetical protein